jgi:hypothetical protein
MLLPNQIEYAIEIDRTSYGIIKQIAFTSSYIDIYIEGAWF